MLLRECMVQLEAQNTSPSLFSQCLCLCLALSPQKLLVLYVQHSPINPLPILVFHFSSQRSDNYNWKTKSKLVIKENDRKLEAIKVASDQCHVYNFCYDFFILEKKMMMKHHRFVHQPKRPRTHFILALSIFVNPKDCFGWSRAFSWSTSRTGSSSELSLGYVKSHFPNRTMKYEKFSVSGVAVHSKNQ